jgi:hypothetical protein
VGGAHTVAGLQHPTTPHPPTPVRRAPADLVVLRLLAVLVLVPLAVWWTRTTVAAVIGGHEPVFHLELAGGLGTASLWLLVWTPLLVTAGCGVVLGAGALVRRRSPSAPEGPASSRGPHPRAVAAQRS